MENRAPQQRSKNGNHDHRRTEKREGDIIVREVYFRGVQWWAGNFSPCGVFFWSFFVGRFRRSWSQKLQKKNPHGKKFPAHHGNKPPSQY